jgi:hypothetical protein
MTLSFKQYILKSHSLHIIKSGTQNKYQLNLPVFYFYKASGICVFNDRTKRRISEYKMNNYYYY